MKVLRPLLLIAGLVLGGCALQPQPAPDDRSPVTENARDFDAYVEHRTDDLTRMGATKNRSEAATQAAIEAERRFGPRAPADSASWSWTTAGKDRSPTPAELDSALAKAH